jgi:hypothetical protein
MRKMKPLLKFLKTCLVFPPVWICAYLFFAYHSMDLFVRTGYGSGTLDHLNIVISAQRSLLSVVLHGQTKEQVIEFVKKVHDRPEHRNVKLEIDDNIIKVGETKIYFTDGKLSVIE